MSGTHEVHIIPDGRANYQHFHSFLLNLLSIAAQQVDRSDELKNGRVKTIFSCNTQKLCAQPIRYGCKFVKLCGDFW